MFHFYKLTSIPDHSWQYLSLWSIICLKTCLTLLFFDSYLEISNFKVYGFSYFHFCLLVFFDLGLCAPVASSEFVLIWEPTLGTLPSKEDLRLPAPEPRSHTHLPPEGPKDSPLSGWTSVSDSAASTYPVPKLDLLLGCRCGICLLGNSSFCIC